jgi:hypothetical protein
LPYSVVKKLVSVFNKTIDRNFCENETSRQMLKELGIKAIVKPLPMIPEKVEKSKEFRVYYENDNATIDLVKAIIKSCPDIKFENEQFGTLKDYACFMSLTGSMFPSENLKRFLMAGRYVITNYCELYSNHTELNKEAIIRKLREYKKGWAKYKGNKKAIAYYNELLSPNKFLKGVR